jgi:hypothetical protein
VYCGWRTLSDSGDTEHVFHVLGGLISDTRVRIRLSRTELNGVESGIGRALLPPERYAVVKMSLFAAFDSAEAPQGLSEPITPNREDILRHLRTLDRL